MAKLTDFKVLSFDVYGTLIDWETGIITALQPLLLQSSGSGGGGESASTSISTKFSKEKLLDVVHECEHTQQAKTPGLKYQELLTAIHPQIATKLGLPAPPQEQSTAFGASVGSWPAFPDTVEALRRLKAHYKIVVLSNVDRESFAGSNSGPLEGVEFDLVLTAQDIRSYKPDLRNFEYMIKQVGDKLQVPKERILQTAQSQFHDHQPAKAMGMKSTWICRPGAIMGNRDNPVYDWTFDTLGEMADAVDVEVKGA